VQLPLKPETAIDDWRHWDAGISMRPTVVKAMRGGRSNQSYLLSANDLQLVLRLNAGDQLIPAIDRKNEAEAWRAASAQKVAPPLIHIDETHTYLVSEYVATSLPMAGQVDEKLLDNIFGLLDRCHQLEADVTAIDYADHIEHYWQLIESNIPQPDPALLARRKIMRSNLEALLSADFPTGLCHHDPSIANFVGQPDRLYLIDWEYAVHGLLVMDYAALAVEWGLDNETVCAKTGIDVDVLGLAKGVYAYMCHLWEAVKSR